MPPADIDVQAHVGEERGETDHPRRLSLLVATYDRPEDLLELLESLALQEEVDDLLEEVLILDNGTVADYSKAWAFVGQHPELRINVLRSTTNLGAAAGKNVLMRTARGEILLIVDDDVVFSTTRDLASLAKSFEAESFRSANLGIVQPRIAYYDTNQLQTTAFPHKRRSPDEPNGAFLTSFFVGAAHLVKKDALEKVGLYPEDFFIYMEEYDLSYRMIASGFAIGYESDVTIRHKESHRGRLSDDAKLRRQWVNKTRVAWRYLPLRYFATTALLWSFEYIRRVKGHPGTFLRAWLDVLRIPFVEPRTPLDERGLAYLRSVDARLWY